MLQDGVTNLSGRLTLVVADHLLNQESVLFVAAVVDSVGVKKEQVAGAHERDLRDVPGGHLALPERHRKISIPVGMVFGNLQAERQELHHVGLANLNESVEFSGKYQRRRVTEVYK